MDAPLCRCRIQGHTCVIQLSGFTELVYALEGAIILTLMDLKRYLLCCCRNEVYREASDCSLGARYGQPRVLVWVKVHVGGLFSAGGRGDTLT